MTDDTALAFEMPNVRAIATANGDPLDRISVRDYTLEVEIGAFQAERGVKQHIRFNVVLEVSRNAAAQSDDVDQVLSYDTITEAIGEQLATERINLLETLAERIAERLLENRKTVRVFVRIEKLDRIPGTLGVDIVRGRIAGDNVLRPHPVLPESHAETIEPLVVFLPNSIQESSDLRAWLDAIDAHELPAVICVEQAPMDAPTSSVPAANRRIRLLSIEQNAWVLAGRDPRCVVVDSRTELDWAIKHGQLSVWAPSKIVMDSVEGPKAGETAPIELAQWLAGELGASGLSVIGETPGPTDGDIRSVATPADL